ncbi:MAG: hypothetical protein E7588_07490 [Ruminococcaceae bacterium]|nr:hypothetical protein [Oscillospiraceae bacterium]
MKLKKILALLLTVAMLLSLDAQLFIFATEDISDMQETTPEPIVYRFDSVDAIENHVTSGWWSNYELGYQDGKDVLKLTAMRSGEILPDPSVYFLNFDVPLEDYKYFALMVKPMDDDVDEAALLHIFDNENKYGVSSAYSQSFGWEAADNQTWIPLIRPLKNISSSASSYTGCRFDFYNACPNDGDVMYVEYIAFFTDLEQCEEFVYGKKLDINKTVLRLEAGKSETLTVASAEGASLTWDSSDEDVATVTDGVVNAVAAGEAVITVTDENGISNACEVKVVDNFEPVVYYVNTQEGIDKYVGGSRHSVYELSQVGGADALKVTSNRNTASALDPGLYFKNLDIYIPEYKYFAIKVMPTTESVHSLLFHMFDRNQDFPQYTCTDAYYNSIPTIHNVQDKWFIMGGELNIDDEDASVYSACRFDYYNSNLVEGQTMYIEYIAFFTDEQQYNEYVGDVMYTVTYDGNGADSGIPTGTAVFSGENTVIAGAFMKRAGYDFKGWSTERDGEVVYKIGDVYSDSKFITLYAVWEKAPDSVTVNYPALSLVTGDSVALSASVVFDGAYDIVWESDNQEAVIVNNGTVLAVAPGKANITATIGGTEVSDICEITVSDKVEPIYYYFNTQDAVDDYVTYGGAMGKSINSEKYELAEEDGGTYLKLTAQAADCGVKLEGLYVPIEDYKYAAVRFKPMNKNDNSGSYIFYMYDGSPAVDGSYKNLSGTLFSNYYDTWMVRGGELTGLTEGKDIITGLRYDFFNINPKLDDVMYIDYIAFFADEAQFASELADERYTVSYDANGGEGAPESQSAFVGETIKLSATVPVRDGYRFMGWASASDRAVEYEPGQGVSYEAHGTLYAVWSEVKYEPIVYRFNTQENIDAYILKGQNTIFELVTTEDGKTVTQLTATGIDPAAWIGNLNVPMAKYKYIVTRFKPMADKNQTLAIFFADSNRIPGSGLSTHLHYWQDLQYWNAVNAKRWIITKALINPKASTGSSTYEETCMMPEYLTDIRYDYYNANERVEAGDICYLDYIAFFTDEKQMDDFLRADYSEPIVYRFDSQEEINTHVRSIPGNTTSELAEIDGQNVLKLTSQVADTNVYFDHFDIPLSKYSHVAIKVKPMKEKKETSSMFHLFDGESWATPDYWQYAGTWSQANAGEWLVLNNKLGLKIDRDEYSDDLAALPEGAYSYTGFRFDPYVNADHGDVMYVEYVAFFTDKEQMDQFLATEYKEPVIYRFDTQENIDRYVAGGFGASFGLATTDDGTDALKMTAVNADCGITFNKFNIPMEDYRYVLAKMKPHSGDADSAMMFHLFDGVEAASSSTPYQTIGNWNEESDGKWLMLNASLENISSTALNYTGTRFDFFASNDPNKTQPGDTAYLEYIAFFTDEAQRDAFLANDNGDPIIYHFDSQEMIDHYVGDVYFGSEDIERYADYEIVTIDGKNVMKLTANHHDPSVYITDMYIPLDKYTHMAFGIKPTNELINDLFLHNLTDFDTDVDGDYWFKVCNLDPEDANEWITVSAEITGTKPGAEIYKGFRFDFYNNMENTKSGDVMYLDYIAFFTSQEQLDSFLNSQTMYTVTYDANGGMGAPVEQTKFENTPLVLANTIPEMYDYIFKGWATSYDAVEAEYAPGDEYDENASVTLYAVWEKEVAKGGMPQITISSVEGIRDKNVEVNVNLKNNPGIAAMNLKLFYDSRLELMEINDNADTFADLTFTDQGEWHKNQHKKYGNGIGLLWDGASNDYSEGILLTLKFKVKPEANKGDYSIMLTTMENGVVGYNDSGAIVSIPVAVTSGVISVKDKKQESVELGDVNGDGTVNAIDLGLLRQVLVNPDKEYNLSGADINGNGRPDLIDVMQLRNILLNS